MNFYINIISIIRRTIASIVLLLLFTFANGQQYIDPALSGSFGSVLNPSYNALLQKGEGEAALLHRRQWAGIEGSPKSIWFNGNIGIGSRGVVAGVNLKQFRFGVERSTEVTASFTKTLRISESEYLGLGVNLGYAQQQGDYMSLDPSDPAFQNVQFGTPIYGLSATLIRPDKYYVGLSMPRGVFGANDSEYVQQFGHDNNYYVTSAAIFDLGEGLYVRPNLLASYRKVTGLQFDGSAMLFFHEKFGLGAGFRQRGDLVGMAEFNLGKMRIAYSYQQNLKNSDLNRYITNSSHELGLSIALGNSKRSRL